MEFNRLLGEQAALMQHVESAGVSYKPIDGSHIPLGKAAFHTIISCGQVRGLFQ